MTDFTTGYVTGLFFGAVIVMGGVIALSPAEAPTVAICESTATYTAGPAQPYAALRKAAATMLRRNEGVHAEAYTDSEGNPTIGVGFNLSRPDALKLLKAVGATRNGTLSPRQIEDLLDGDLTEVLQDLVTLFPAFGTMPERAQLVLIDLRFNCGPGGLRTFVNTMQAFKTAQWHDAARRLEQSQWASQVGDRASRAVGLLRGIS